MIQLFVREKNTGAIWLQSVLVVGFRGPEERCWKSVTVNTWSDTRPGALEVDFS